MKAFLYGRHSTDKQDLTEEVQHDMCLRFFIKELQPKGVVLAPPGWFYDAAVSSSIFMGERDVGRIVIASLQPGDHLVVAKISRSFRSLQDGTATLAQLELRGVSIHVVDLPVDPKRASGRLVRNVSMVVDQYIREIAGEHQREIIAYRRQAGLPWSKGVPIGWRTQGEKPHRVFRVDMEERVLADHLKKRYGQGLSLRQLAYWCSHQTQMPCKRRFVHRDAVRWAINAAEKGFPKVSGYKTLRKMIRLGQI